MSENKYRDYVDKVVIPYSQSVGYDFEGEEYVVGALSRMNLNKSNLHKDTKNDAGRFLGKFPSKNIYDNDLAQAIEVLHCVDSSIEIMEGTEFKPESTAPVVVKAGEGVGLIEAPRGILYYMLNIDDAGKIQYGNIIVPTSQNQVSMEKSIAQVVQENIGESRQKITFELEKLIRAYDPCMSCASHFLRVNWLY